MKILDTKTQFVGTCGIDGHILNVGFQVRIDNAGEVAITLDEVKRTTEAQFITTYADQSGTEFARFSLRGHTDNGMSFSTDDFLVTNLKRSFGPEGATLIPNGVITKATVSYSDRESDSRFIRWNTKGFYSIRSLQATTPLGQLTMTASDGNAPNEISGYFEISSSTDRASDIGEWANDAASLLAHLQFLFSFAGSSRIRVPIIEKREGGNVDLTFLSQVDVPGESAMPVIHQHDYQQYLDVVIAAHESPPVKVQNLAFAIEWFTMASSYPESGLISAMTVLENLIDSNLKDEDKTLLSNEQYEPLRKRLSQAVKQQIVEWDLNKEEGDDLLREINERFVELKRHTLLRKLKTLTNLWKVSLEGIEDASVNAAKKARDSVVHRGHYSSVSSRSIDLHDHLVLVRELVVRIILTAIGYRGNYCSYPGGYRRCMFPVLLDVQDK
jgi:hypothetical protein